jgi:UDP-N-acetylglucosamine 2-epimerase (non-hydrolysing)
VKVLSIVGARPQFVKLAPVARALDTAAVHHVIVHTGQHYDHRMSEAFFADLGIPSADVHLGVGSGGHGAQTGAMLVGLDPVLDEHRPDWVLVYGDTNSTLAGAISATKLHLPVAHLEAGLRSGNRRMPEEINRVLTDHAADLCLAPTELAMRNLEAEGLTHRARLVGDVMTDVCLMTRDLVSRRGRTVVGVPTDRPFALATLHRAENTDYPQRLERLVTALAGLPLPVVLPVHPRLRDKAATSGIALDRGSLVPVEPLSYPEMVAAVSGATAVITDSGGLQKEAFLLQTPCITLRSETEWSETLEGGWNVLSPDGEGLADLIQRPVGRPASMPYGGGDASDQVVAALRGGAAFFTS